MEARRHRHAAQRQTQPGIERMTPWHGTRFGAAQGPAPFLVPSPDPKQTPHFMSPNSGGTNFAGPKQTPKSAPPKWTKKSKPTGGNCMGALYASPVETAFT